MSLLRWILLLLALIAGLAAAAARAQVPPRPGPLPLPRPEETLPPAKPHRTGELECRNCHQGKHQGVLGMYVGMGGRGTPMIPSHMFQVRVECVACHIAPKEAEAAAGIVGQTFKPTERACIGCHGEKYRGMIERWAKTLDGMRETVAPKLAGARAALAAAEPKNSRSARARQLVDDADFNIQFVALGKGVHNVFYAADLLKLANGWLDEVQALLGKAPVKADDMLVRGGYCAVLCHEQAGVKLPETVRFAKRRIPHGRHVSEFGAVCTVCHSAEVHKAVTATAQTCVSCHHSPLNERCESCHRAQSEFYRGRVKVALAKADPNSMAEAVACVGCHDFTHKHSRQAVDRKCVACHEASYLSFMNEWTSGMDKETALTAAALKRGETALAAARRAGRAIPGADALLKEARDALTLLKNAKGVHNPAAADALLDVARRKTAEALAQAEIR